MFLLANESPWGAVTGHTFEQKEQRRRKEKQTQIVENMQRLSRDTGQWDGNGCRSIWEWPHYMAFWCKLNQWIQGRFSNIKAHPPDPRLSRDLSQNSNWLARWNGSFCSKCKPPPVSPISTWVLDIGSIVPLAGSLQKVYECWRRYKCRWKFSSIFRNV